MDDWENEDGANINVGFAGDKWEGEDEDDDVKDNWEDEEEEKKDEEKKPEPAPVAAAAAVVVPVKNAKKPKKLLEKIEEKEQREREEAERKALEKEAAIKLLTPEQICEEKLRQEKLQRESDLKAALDTTFGGTTAETNGRLSVPDPESKEDFDELELALAKKMQMYSKSAHFANFASDLIRDICVQLPSVELKKLKTTVENLFIEKQKIEKGDKSKKNKGKGKAKLKIEGENSIVNEYAGYDYDEFDDFM